MTFLPVVERELRVVARRPGTYWGRLAAAACVMGVWLALLIGSRAIQPDVFGKNLFFAFGVIALSFCLIAGIFLTSDCLSEEKREGTLGLLFLTDLRGYDVVLGKLIGTSVRSANGLVAVLPILGLPLLMGGVTRGEFGRVVLALLAALAFSLSLGMLVSALNRDARQAMSSTFLGLLTLGGLLPAFWWLGKTLGVILPSILTLLPSPVYLFMTAFDSRYRIPSGRDEFWTSLIIVLSLALMFLTLAALVLPKSWQEGKVALKRGTKYQVARTFIRKATRSGWGIARALFFFALRWQVIFGVCTLLFLTVMTLLILAPNLFLIVQTGMLWLFFAMILCFVYLGLIIAVGGIHGESSSTDRRQVLERNPFFWLASRDKRSKVLAWIITAILGTLWACFFVDALTGKKHPPFFISLITAYALHQAFKLLVGLEATRQLSESRRNGGLELLLISPLEERKIIEGQVEALKEHFKGVRRALFVINCCLCGLILLVNPLSMNTEDQAAFLELFLGGILMLVLDFRALGEVGMLMALRCSRHHRATLATYFRIMGIPWMAIFVVILLGISRALNGIDPLPVFTIWFALGAATDLSVSAHARNMLSRGIRTCLEMKTPVPAILAPNSYQSSTKSSAAPS
jgi:ABC-type multidrug transport system permease subunit